MAVYFLRGGHVSRGKGGRVTRAAAERRARETPDPERDARRRAAALRGYHERKQKNPEGIRLAARRWRAEHADEVNRKQQEYRQSRGGQRSKRPAPTALQSAQNWRAYRESQPSIPTAKESAQAWREFREREAAQPDGGARSNAIDRPDTAPKPSAGGDYDFSL